MEYAPMELENSFDCFNYCRYDLLTNLQKNKEEILFFEDRKSASNDVLIVVVKQRKSNKKREHVILKAVTRLTIMLKPRVGICRYFVITGKHVS